MDLGSQTAQPPNPYWMGRGGWTGRGPGKAKSLAGIRGRRGGDRWESVLRTLAKPRLPPAQHLHLCQPSTCSWQSFK